MTNLEKERAKALYGRWFKKYPRAKNPSDINTLDKYNFAMQIGFEGLRLMQAARKASMPFTLSEFWED